MPDSTARGDNDRPPAAPVPGRPAPGPERGPPPLLSEPWRLTRAERLDGFHPARCRTHPELRPVRLGREAALVADAGGADVYRPAAPVADEPELFAVKNLRAAGYLADEAGWRRLTRHGACASCADLHRCPTCLEPATEPGPPPAGGDGTLRVEGGTARPLSELLSRPGELASLLQRSGGAHLLLSAPNPYFVLWSGRGQAPAPARVPSPWAAARLLAAAGALGVSVDARPPLHPFAGPSVELSLGATGSPRLGATAVLCFNRRCVTLCRYCRLPLQLPGDMALPAAAWAIDQFAACGFQGLNLFGGEVTLRPDLEDLVAYGARAGLQPQIVTTGAGLSPQRCRRLAELGLAGAEVSIDSAVPAVHDRMKARAGLFDLAADAARAFSGAGVPVCINAVLHPDCFRDLPGLGTLAAQLGARRLSLYHCVEMPGAGVRVAPLTPGEVRELYEGVLPALHEECRRAGVRLSVYPRLDTGGAGRARTYAMLAEGVYNRIQTTSEPCAHVRSAVFVWPDGAVVPCMSPSVVLDPAMAVGNLEREPLWSILSGPAAARFREQAGRLDGCRQCFQTHDAPETPR